MKNRIYFFANFGDWNKLPHGGGEVGNRKTLEFFKKGGFDIVLIPKYLHVPDHSAKNVLLLIYRIICNIFVYIKVLLFGRRQNSVVHISGFYGAMIYFEFLLICIAKCFRYHVVYEMRGGGADTYFMNGNSFYRYIFKAAIKKANVIFTQGGENIPLIKSLDINANIFYYPNYVTEDFYPHICPIKPKDSIRLMYFGRISAAKHVDIVVDTFIKLKKVCNDVSLDIIGNCSDDIFLADIKKEVEENGYSDFVTIRPACDHEKLKKYLADKHFYIFPSTEPREGHSNALTEAMAWGLIPIATAHGFNRSVIGNDSLIVENLCVDEFVSRILAIINNEKMDCLSHEMYDRVIHNYTDEIVYKRFIDKYNDLFNIFFRNGKS